MTKGFTLVELLAVIVILAVLALIATPVVLSIIDDAKESAMLRSAEMYLSGVENAVMRENMNSGGNFRPNDCTLSNGNMTCGSTNVEVEVDGEVPSTGSIVFENGKITQVTLNYESGTIVKDASGNLVYEGSENESQKVAITPKKETYTIGEEVEIEGEHFYVIGDDAEKVTLLAKDCIDTTNLLQSASAGTVAFSTESYWGEGTSPYDIEETTPIPESHIAAKTAYDYGTKIGGSGRLMTYTEAETLKTVNSDILYGTNGKSSGTFLVYWLGSTYDVDDVWRVWMSAMGPVLNYGNYSDNSGCGLRPVVEISKSSIN